MTLHCSRTMALLVVLFVGCTTACQTTGPAPDADELPGELSMMPDPRVVPSAQLNQEILEREARRSTATGALVVRYPEEEFEEIYGHIKPMEEQEWWPEVSDGLTPEEYLLANHGGQPYIATTREGGYVYVRRGCMPEAPNLSDFCIHSPITGECACTTPGPGWEVDDILPVTDDVPCEAGFILGRARECRLRTGCSTLCTSFGTGSLADGYLCECRDDLEFGGG